MKNKVTLIWRLSSGLGINFRPLDNKHTARLNQMTDQNIQFQSDDGIKTYAVDSQTGQKLGVYWKEFSSCLVIANFYLSNLVESFDTDDEAENWLLFQIKQYEEESEFQAKK